MHDKITTLPKHLQEWLFGSSSMNMLVTGMTGIGKSSLINGIIGKNIMAEGRDTLDRRTFIVQAFSFKYHNVDI